MRIIFTILLLSNVAFGQSVYHIKNGGNDALNGLTDTTAWEHLSKIKSGSFLSGDSILLKRGDAFNDSIRIVTSGINIGAYGTGANPIVTGFRLMSLTSEGGNIYSGYSSGIVKDLNCVLINGQLGYKARYPNIDSTNGGFLTATSANYYSVTTAFSMPSSFAGSELILRGSHYTYDKSKVINQDSVINVRDPFTYGQMYYGANGFFFQNDSTFLDRAGEWYNDSTSHRFKVYSTDPVYESIIDTLVSIYHANNVSITNIDITGANRIGLLIDSCNNVKIDRDSIYNIGKRGINVRKNRRLKVTNSTIKDVFTSGIMARGDNPYDTTHYCDTCTFSGNYFKNISLYAGMGQYNYGDSRHEGIGLMPVGDSNLVTNNRFDSIGYIGIYWVGKNNYYYRNYFTNFCTNRDDGGAFMTNLANLSFPRDANKGSIYRSNIMVNAIGLDDGSNIPSFAAGIYMDAGSRLQTLDSNTAIGGHYAVLYSNGADSITTTNNLFVNNTGTQTVQFTNGGGTWPTSGNVWTNNIFYNPTTDAYTGVMNILGASNLGRLDSNYYIKGDSTYPFTINANPDGGNPITWAQYRSTYNQDAHSVHSKPAGTTSATPLIVYNPTLSDSTIYFTGLYKDAKGGNHNNLITLHPFQSAILFKSIKEIDILDKFLIPIQ